MQTLRYFHALMQTAEKQHFLNKVSRLQHQIQDTVSAGGISILHPFVPLPLFSHSLALYTIKNLLWRDQAGTEHCATPGLFTEVFWRELQEDEMPIRLPSIFATASSWALGFTDIISCEFSSLQHLSKLYAYPPWTWNHYGTSNSTMPENRLPINSHASCSWRLSLYLLSQAHEMKTHFHLNTQDLLMMLMEVLTTLGTDLRLQKLSQCLFSGSWWASFSTPQRNRTRTKSTLRKQINKQVCSPPFHASRTRLTQCHLLVTLLTSILFLIPLAQ